MHITLETDYAIRIVDILAKQKLTKHGYKAYPSRLDAKTIAERTDIPLRFAVKILGKLANAGIIRSYKGVHGGYELSSELAELSLYDVIAGVQGDYHLSRCLADGYDCNCNTKGLPCSYQMVFAGISDAVREQLTGFTFDKLLNMSIITEKNEDEQGH